MGFNIPFFFLVYVNIVCQQHVNNILFLFKNKKNDTQIKCV